MDVSDSITDVFVYPQGIRNTFGSLPQGQPSQLQVEGARASPVHRLAVRTLLQRRLHRLCIFTVSRHLRYVSQLEVDNVYRAFGLDIPNAKLTIVGDGTTPISFTARPDVAHFVAHTLTHLPPSSLHNATLQAEGEKATFVEVARAMEEVFGKPFEVVNVPVALAEEQSKAGGPKAFAAWIGLGMQRAYADVGVAENELVPGFKPLTVRESLQKHYV